LFVGYSSTSPPTALAVVIKQISGFNRTLLRFNDTKLESSVYRQLRRKDGESHLSRKSIRPWHIQTCDKQMCGSPAAKTSAVLSSRGDLKHVRKALVRSSKKSISRASCEVNSRKPTVLCV
jgi:hypothetical protein